MQVKSYWVRIPITGTANVLVLDASSEAEAIAKAHALDYESVDDVDWEPTAPATIEGA